MAALMLLLPTEATVEGKTNDCTDRRRLADNHKLSNKIFGFTRQNTS